MRHHLTTTYRAASLATRTQSGAATAMAVAGIQEGQLFVRVLSLPTGQSLRPTWETSPANGIWSPHTAIPTFSGGATGTRMIPLSHLGREGRLAWTLGATAPSRFEGWLIVKT